MAVSLTVGGVDITNDVQFTGSSFTTLVNGTPGTCNIIVNDPSFSKSFKTGARILLKFGTLNVWAGYLMRQRRIYPFPRHSPPECRLFELIGLDINVLFHKRYVWKLSNPAGKGPTYPEDTSDITVLEDLFDRFIDLTGDDLDVSSLVSHVGNVNADQVAYPIKPGDNWYTTMQMIGNQISPVFYLNPDRKLVWADVDVEDAPFDLTDHPDPLVETDHGYREMRLIRDGAEMVNDALFIGAGYGDQGLVYKRTEDQDSIDEHNRWQTGGWITGIYKQGSINRITNSWVNGSPQSRRGRKNDKISVMCATFDEGLRAGMKVDFTSGVWGYNDVLPIRQMRVSWPVATKPKFELLLSHELDSPFTFFDPMPPIDAGGVPKPPPIPPPDIPVVPTPDCVDDMTGTEPQLIFYDYFNRDEASEWGWSTSGVLWLIDEFGEYSVEDATELGYHEVSLGDGGESSAYVDGVIETSTASMLVTMRIGSGTTWGSNGAFCRIGPVEVALWPTGYSVLYPWTIRPDGAQPSWSEPSGPDSVSPTGLFNWRIDVEQTGEMEVLVKSRVWDVEDEEPTGWMSATYTFVTSIDLPWDLEVGFNGSSQIQAFYDLVQATIYVPPEGIELCDWFLDTFDRTVEEGLGSADTGQPWSTCENCSVSPGNGALFSLPGGDGAYTVIYLEAEPPSYMEALGYFYFEAQILPDPLKEDPYAWDNLVWALPCGEFWFTHEFFDDLGIDEFDPFRIVVSWNGGNVVYRAWQSEADEPTSWTVADESVGFYSVPVRDHTPFSVSGSDASGFEVVFWHAEAGYAYEGIDPISGYTCEEFGGYSGMSSVTLDHDYVSGTIEIFLNGLFQTSFSEDGGNSVTIAFPTISSDVVKVCYLIQGDDPNWSDDGHWWSGYQPI